MQDHAQLLIFDNILNEHCSIDTDNLAPNPSSGTWTRRTLVAFFPAGRKKDTILLIVLNNQE